MKRCPECRRDYYDDTMLYCLDDGERLLSGGALSEQATAVFRPSEAADGRKDAPVSLGQSSFETSSSIAVLPFTNISSDTENEYFCDGLAGELLNTLAKVRGLGVVSRTSAFAFKGKDASTREIAAALGVDALLEGGVQRFGNRIRIAVELIRACDDRLLWSERYDREATDLFDVQDEIVVSVVKALELTLLGDEKTRVLKRYTNNFRAYQLFLNGRYHWYKHSPNDLMRSREYFQQAVDLDPNYAPGYAGLGECYGLSAALGFMPPDEGWRAAEAILMKALLLDDEIPEIHNGLAAIRLLYHRDWTGAVREIRHTIELNPKFAEVHNLYSFCLVANGRVEDAIAEGQRALELDPLSCSYQFYLGRWFYFACRFEEAVDAYNTALELEGDHSRVYEALGDVYGQKGMNDEAVAAWRRALVIMGDEELADVLDRSYTEKDFDKAVQAVASKKLERLNKKTEANEYVPAVEYARCYIRLGNIESAFASLEKVAEERNAFALQIGVDPIYDALREDPRFNGVLKRVGLAVQ